LYSKALISIVNLLIEFLPVFQFPPSIMLLQPTTLTLWVRFCEHCLTVM
jgi:hypothetical protein